MSQHFPHIKSHFHTLLNSLEPSDQSFVKTANDQLNSICDLLKSRFQNTQTELRSKTTFIIDCQKQKIELRKKIAQTMKQCEEHQNWNQVRKGTVEMQKVNIKHLERCNANLKETCAEIDSMSKEVSIKINQKRLRRDKIVQFNRNIPIKGSKSFDSDKNKPNQKSLQQNNRKLSPFGYNKKATQLKIQFNPEQKELIFRVQTFEGKVVEFLLFFDENDGKYELKNPFKSLKSSDIQAVRNFNVHQDRKKLINEFRELVKIFIDNNSV